MDTVQFFAEDVDFPFNKKQASVLKHWLFLTAQSEGFTISNLNIIFCNDEHLLGINIEYLNHNYYTDIITFDNSEVDEEIEGDVFISTERVMDNAMELGLLSFTELLRVMAHGLLHLCGYGDKSEEEIVIMRSKEDHYISLYTELIDK